MKTNFILGDSVIALNSASPPNQPRVKGNAYTITDIIYCATTGEQLVNINNTKSRSTTLNCVCGKKHPNDGLAFTRSKYFVLNTPNAIEEKMQESIQIEDYETAVLLRDLNITI